MSTRRALLQASLGTALLASLRPASAQDVEQPKILYGFPPGSAGDSVARRVAERLSAAGYGRLPALVDNRAGAGGRIALEALKGAPPDGSTLALTPFSTVAIYPHVFTKLRYAPQDFVPVSTAAYIHHGLAVGPQVPAGVKNLKDFLAWAKANPPLATYGSPGAGSTPHFIGALLGLSAGIELRHVPYRGSVPGVTDLVAGQIASMVTPSGDFLPNHRAGKVRLLATTGRERSPFTPEVATFLEQGYPDLVVEEWFGFLAPPATPAGVVARANAAINAALKEPAVVESFNVLALIARGCTPEEMARSQKTELERWGPLIKRIGFTSDT